MTKDSFEWVDVLMRRWQIIAALAGAIAWLTSIQIQLAYGNNQTAELRGEVDSFHSIRAEWPYLKDKVATIDKKLDVLLSRSSNN